MVIYVLFCCLGTNMSKCGFRGSASNGATTAQGAKVWQVCSDFLAKCFFGCFCLMLVSFCHVGVPQTRSLNFNNLQKAHHIHVFSLY